MWGEASAHGRVLLIDLGGGSCEVTLSEDRRIREMVSLPLGAVRLTQDFLLHDPPRKDEVAERLRACMHAKLNLTDEQKPKVDAIIERSSKEVWSLHGEHMARLRQAVTSRNKELMAILNPEQKQQFEQIERERKEAARAREGSGGKTNNSSWRSGQHGPRRGTGDRS